MTVDICLEYRSRHESSVAMLNDNDDNNRSLVKNRYNKKDIRNKKNKEEYKFFFLQNKHIDCLYEYVFVDDEYERQNKYENLPSMFQHIPIVGLKVTKEEN